MDLPTPGHDDARRDRPTPTAGHDRPTPLAPGATGHAAPRRLEDVHRIVAPGLGFLSASTGRGRHAQDGPHDPRLRERHLDLVDLLGTWRRASTDAERAGIDAGHDRLLRVVRERPRDRVVVLRNRAIPGSAVRLATVVVSSVGVHVIETLPGAHATRVVQHDESEPRLLVDGHDRTDLVTALLRRRELVRRTVAAVEPGVPVDGVLCAAGDDTTHDGPRRILGLTLATPGAAAALVHRPGRGTGAQVDLVARAIAERFPAA